MGKLKVLRATRPTPERGLDDVFDEVQPAHAERPGRHAQARPALQRSRPGSGRRQDSETVAVPAIPAHLDCSFVLSEVSLGNAVTLVPTHAELRGERQAGAKAAPQGAGELPPARRICRTSMSVRTSMPWFEQYAFTAGLFRWRSRVQSTSACP